MSIKEFIQILIKESLPELNIEEFKSVPYKEKLQYLNTKFTKIAEGTSRFVYDIGSGWVLKLAVNKAGIAQNSEESSVCTGGNKQLEELFPRIRDIGPGYEWLVVQRAAPMSSTSFEHLTKMSYYEFLGGMLGVFDLKNATEDQKKMATKLFRGNKLFNQLVELIRSCQYEPGDLLRIDSWGIVNNKPVIIDSGLTNAVYRKFYERKAITESYVVQEADYPQGFDINTFKSLRSFPERIRYAKQHLAKLGQGSARIAMLADPTTVIKIARNNKGLAQNKVEIDASNIGYEHITQIKDYDQDGLWVEVERAKRIGIKEFEQLTGFKFKDFTKSLEYWWKNTMQTGRSFHVALKPNRYDEITETDMFYDITAMVANHDMAIGDMLRPSSWGVVVRKGKNIPVLLDYGITKELYQTHYVKPRTLGY